MNTRNIISQTTQIEALARAWIALRQYEQIIFANNRQQYPFGKDAEEAAGHALAEFLGIKDEYLNAQNVWPLVATWTDQQRKNADLAQYGDLAQSFPRSELVCKKAIGPDYHDAISYDNHDNPQI